MWGCLLIDVVGGAEKVLIHDGDAFGVRNALYLLEVDFVHSYYKFIEKIISL